MTSMVEQLIAYRAMSSSGGLLRQVCPGCTQTLREGLSASAARAAFSLGYSCATSENGVANAHGIIGACGHASLFALAFEHDKSDEDQVTGWGVLECCMWALVQLLSVAKKRQSATRGRSEARTGVREAAYDATGAPRRARRREERRLLGDALGESVLER